MAPAFRQEQLALSVDKVVCCANRLLEHWQDGEERDIRADMTRLTIEIASKVLFDVELDRAVAGISRAVDRGIEEISKRFKRGIFIPDWIPTPGNRRYLATVRDLDAAVANILAERRASCRDRTDLLSTLLHSRDAGGRPMDARLLRDELVAPCRARDDGVGADLDALPSLPAPGDRSPNGGGDRCDSGARASAGRRRSRPTALPRLGNHRGHAPLSARLHCGAGGGSRSRNRWVPALPRHHLPDEPVGCAPRSTVLPGTRDFQARALGRCSRSAAAALRLLSVRRGPTYLHRSAARDDGGKAGSRHGLPALSTGCERRCAGPSLSVSDPAPGRSCPSGRHATSSRSMPSALSRSAKPSMRSWCLIASSNPINRRAPI